jgi:hypothetical protein
MRLDIPDTYGMIIAKAMKNPPLYPTIGTGSAGHVLAELLEKSGDKEFPRKIMRCLNKTHELFTEVEKSNLSRGTKNDVITLLKQRQLFRLKSINVENFMGDKEVLHKIMEYAGTVIVGLARTRIRYLFQIKSD